MNNIFSGFLALAMALAMITPAASPALADSGGDLQPQLSTPASLTIKSPNTVEAGQQATFTVFSKHGHEAVAGASVYALKTGGLVIRAGAANYTALPGEYEALTEARGILFGTTGGDGTVKGKLSETGRFMLVATKDGYIPGFARLTVTPAAGTALNIKALFNISAGQPATLKVWEKGTNQPVAAAAVYVLKTGGSANIWAMPPPANNDKSQVETNRAREKGTLAGYTDDKGQVAFTFGSSGQYILAAFKDGYSPAFSYITYTLPNTKKSLTITAPSEAYANAAVNISAYDAGGGALGKVGIYSLRMDTIAQAAAALQSAAKPDAAAREKYGPILRERSSFLGYTDGNGQLNVKFPRTGAFMLLAIRDGYLPDFAKINIKPAPPPVPAPVPLPTPIPQSENATITE